MKVADERRAMTLVEQVQYANDNGAMFWPPECELERWDKLVAQAWEKFDDPAERRKITERREAVRCTTPLRCWKVSPPKEVIEEVGFDGMSVHFVDAQARQTMDVACGHYLVSWRAAPLHQAEKHPGQACTFDFVNLAWTYEILGFSDLYWGKPRGWYDLLDGEDPSVRQWEYDVLELGTATADHWWNTPY